MRKIAVILLVVAMFFAAGYLQQNAKNLAMMGQSVLNRIGIIPSLSANRQAQIELTYIPATSSAPEGRERVTVYFTDPDAMYLVPVSRVISKTEYPVRASLDEFLKGPQADSGLMKAAPPMTINKVTIANGVLAVDIPQQVVEVSSKWGSTGATLALDGILSTCSEQSWVDQVQFLVDGKTTPVLFHGLAASAPFKADHRASDGQKAWVYLALYVGNRAYLVPERVALTSQGPTDAIKKALDLLKQDLVRGDFKLRATVPEAVKVKSVRVEEKTAFVDLSGKVKEAFANDPVRQSLMVDSMILTVTTFPGVDKVQFTLDGKAFDQPFGHVNLGRVLSRPRWVNPEQ
ncbi:MAG TPA: GerMN domain-containing protein [Bacillota bacterium]|jgi:spore germination protein GerM